jgi:hypothetical protein
MKPYAASVFRILEVHSQKTIFIHYPLISGLFLSSLSLVNPSHIKKKNTVATRTAVFFPKRLSPHSTLM